MVLGAYDENTSQKRSRNKHMTVTNSLSQLQFYHRAFITVKMSMIQDMWSLNSRFFGNKKHVLVLLGLVWCQMSLFFHYIPYQLHSSSQICHSLLYFLILSRLLQYNSNVVPGPLTFFVFLFLYVCITLAVLMQMAKICPGCIFILIHHRVS